MVVIKIPQIDIISKLKGKKKLFAFLLVFVLSLSILYTLSIFFESYIPLFNMRMTAFVLHELLNLVGIKNTLSVTDIIFSNQSLSIVRQCTGIFEVIALSSVIIAYPTTAAKKIIGIVYGMLIIYFFNLGRLILLAGLLVYNVGIFELAHDYILQFSFVFLVVFVFLVWINKIVKPDTKNKTADIESDVTNDEVVKNDGGVTNE